MTQTPRPLFGGYINIPEDEKFNPNRPSLDAACYGNRTMGNILNYFLQRAVHEVEWQKLGKDCKVVTFSIKDREKILQELRISEKTYITYLGEFNTLGYVGSQLYSKEYTVSFEAVNKGIAYPPASKHRGRPRKSESCNNLPQENTSTFRKNTSTYVHELEEKVEVISEELKVLQEERKVLQHFQKDLQQIWKVLQLSKSCQTALTQVLSTDFEAPKILQILPDSKEEYGDAPFVASPSSAIPIAKDDYEPQASEMFSSSGTQVSSGDTGVPGYVKGGRNEPGTDGMGTGDASAPGRDTAPDSVGDRDHTRVTQEQEEEMTQQAIASTLLPVDRGLPAGERQSRPLPGTWMIPGEGAQGDARESALPPSAASLLPSRTPFYDIDVFAEDTWVIIPGRATGTVRGEETPPLSTSNAASQPTGNSTTEPVSLSKTHSTRRNKKSEVPAEEPLLEVAPIEPDMHGIWNHEKVVQYTEWCTKQRYRDTERTRQLNAARAIYKDDHALTLEHYKQAYDERNDEWWQETKGALHVTHMRGKEKSGIDRLHAMLDRIAARKAKSNGKGSTSSPSSAPLGGMYKDKTAELAAERAKYMGPPVSSDSIVPRVAASAISFHYAR